MTDHSMVEERDDVRPPDARTITATDVQGWFKKIRPNDAQCAKIAERLTKMRWPSDPPKQPLPDDAREWYWRARMWQPTDPPLRKPDSVGAKEMWDFEQPKGPGGISGIKYALRADGSWLRQDINWDPTLPDPDSVETNGWWDEFQGAADAADKLRASIPAMLARLERPETRNGYNAIKALGEALAAAKQYLGNHKHPAHPKRRRLRRRPNGWNTPALLIAHTIGKALVASGHDARSLERTSAVTPAVYEALRRMRYPGIEMVSCSAVSRFLIDWAHDFDRSLE
jgi:hypothetical protein